MRALAAAVALAALTACSEEEGGSGGAPSVVRVTPPADGEPWERLSEWSFFSDVAGQVPADDVHPYDVIAPLFSEYTHKQRFLYLPEGERIGPSDDTVWDLPVGAALVKTFAYPRDGGDPASGLDLLETRVLYHEADGWTAHTYVYEDDDRDAVREVAGELLPGLSVTKPDGSQLHDFTYRVPNTNDCKECHQGADERLVPLGVSTRQLDRAGPSGAASQVDRFAELGLFTEAIPEAGARARLVDPFGDGDLAARARSYLDSNCGHCHAATGVASDQALRLGFWDTDPEVSPSASWGVCVTPTSCSCCDGLSFDVVPGDSASSLMICRVEATEDEVRMPPTSELVHDEGVGLLRAWIDGMDPLVCR